MANKLFLVEVTYTAYALAADRYEAEDLAREITSTEDYPNVSVVEATSNALGWDPECLVYHNGGEDITLGSVLDGLNKPSSDSD
jgi:hypothetical protein